MTYAHERHGEETDDVALLSDCAETGRVLLTNDRDFARLGERHDHDGIVIYTDRHRVLDRPQAAVSALDRLLAHYSPAELRGTVEWLDAWA